MNYGPRCRVCGRTPEDVLAAACRQPRVADARFAAMTYRTRWRATLCNLRDEICWWCALFATRFEAEREGRAA